MVYSSREMLEMDLPDDYISNRVKNWFVDLGYPYPLKQ
jgi:hypothetical protein